MSRPRLFARTVGVFAFLAFALPAALANAQSTAFKQALAEAVVKDRDIAQFYQANGYAAIWTGTSNIDRNRRRALIDAFQSAGAHGLPAGRFDPTILQSLIGAAKTPAEKGALEGQLSNLFLQYTRAMQTGVLVPSRVDSEIVRDVPYRGRASTLVAFAKSGPAAFMRSLPPKAPEYARLMKEKMRMQRLVGNGGWGPKVSARSLKPGASGDAVVALRNRLTAMGLMARTNTVTYDAAVQKGVQQFQVRHGLSADGVAGEGTLREINKTATERLASVLVAMERERWNNRPLGERHVLVNLTDYSAKIIDNDKVTFQTRSVVGANKSDRRSPEFSDVMEFMVINPSWYVPRSITTTEYLPMLKRNKNAVSHLELRDSRGNAISRAGIDFNSFNENNFPYSFRQPPSRRNALGLVKFMFPNKYNIYLHDTPAKALFGRETRAYSHGCVRLADPFDFAYALLAKQESDPKSFFQSRLATNSEARVNLNQPVPVHLIYRTAIAIPGGGLQFRRDVYGRDARIWNALQREGVVLQAVSG